MYFDYTKKLNY